MSIIDRRQNQKDKSLGSRQRFIRRAASQVKKAISDSVSNTDIKDFGKKGITVPVKGIGEPTFTPDQHTGKREKVLNGNKDYLEGDRLPKPRGGAANGTGKGEASNEGEGEDGFVFALSHDEFLEYFFEDLELPNLVEKQLKELLKNKPKRAGFTTTGNPANLSITNTVKHAIGRRVALGRPKREEVEELQSLLEEESKKVPGNALLIEEITQKIAALEARMKIIPFVDNSDLRYRSSIMEPAPNTKAVVVMLMDVSGSMSEREKDIAKRFFILLYLLLVKKYTAVEIVFVRHHTRAEVCTEHEFFYKQESGGTVVSSGLKLVNEVLARYSPNEYNQYVAQASDGDNWDSDREYCIKEYGLMLPLLQHYCYIDIPNEGNDSSNSNLWETVATVERSHENMSMAKVHGINEIWPVFMELFKKEK